LCFSGDGQATASGYCHPRTQSIRLFSIGVRNRPEC
jgi:hypothetical protein